MLRVINTGMSRDMNVHTSWFSLCAAYPLHDRPLNDDNISNKQKGRKLSLWSCNSEAWCMITVPASLNCPRSLQSSFPHSHPSSDQPHPTGLTFMNREELVSVCCTQPYFLKCINIKILTYVYPVWVYSYWSSILKSLIQIWENHVHCSSNLMF